MRVFVLIVAFGLACGGDSSGPPAVTPNALVRVAGDSQAALTGTPLPNALRIRVNGSNSQPYAGATVTWTVLTGTATLGTPSVTSDSQGNASTTVTLGATPGAVAIQASVTGVTPLTFGAKACDHPVFTLNDTVPGALATTDCRLGSYFTDFFDLNVPAGPQGLVLTMESAAFDTYLELYSPSFDRQGTDDDIDYPANTNARLTAIVAPGDYLIAPSSAAQFTIGDYTLSVITQQPALAGCGLVWVTRGVTVSDSVTTTDCVDSTGGTFYADAVGLELIAGSVLKVSLHSAAFDAALFLYNATFGTQVLANNDSAGGTTDAYLAYSVATTGPYVLFVGTNDSLATGAYTLYVSATTTSLGASREGGGRQLLPLGTMRMPKGLPQRAWRH